MFVKRARRTASAIAGAAILVLGLSSCAIIEGPTPKTPPRTQPAVPEPDSVELVPGGTAEENLPFFTTIIANFAAGEQPIEGQPIVDAVASAGFEKAEMQVSFDLSRTNLVADSLFVSVRLGETCLIGQLITENREYAVEALPAVGPNTDICIIGETRPIDW